MEIHKKCNIIEFILILPTHLLAKIKSSLIDPCYTSTVKQNTGSFYYTIQKKSNIYKEKTALLEHSFESYNKHIFSLILLKIFSPYNLT